LDLIPYCDMIEFMAINPGMLGTNSYLDIILNKAKQIRDSGIVNSDIKLGTDGGVKWGTINDLMKAGISYQVAGSGILFNNDSLIDNCNKIKHLKSLY